MTKSTGVGRGGKRAGAGRKSQDGRKTVMDTSIALDQETLDCLVREFGADEHGFGYAVRELAHSYLRMNERARENTAYASAGRYTGGHTQNITTRAAAAPETVGGHAKTNTQVSGAAGGAAKRDRPILARRAEPADVEDPDEKELAETRALFGLPRRGM